jgi:hypothetical protein
MILQINEKKVGYILERPHKTIELLHEIKWPLLQHGMLMGFHKNILPHLAKL